MSQQSRRQLLSGTAAATMVTVFAARPAAADQPHMEAALDALKTARRELGSATADKGGHRAKALDLVKEAMAEVERGIDWAKHH